MRERECFQPKLNPQNFDDGNCIVIDDDDTARAEQRADNLGLLSTNEEARQASSTPAETTGWKNFGSDFF